MRRDRGRGRHATTCAWLLCVPRCDWGQSNADATSRGVQLLLTPAEVEGVASDNEVVRMALLWLVALSLFED